MWRRPDGRALVSTADFFTPIVDDAFTWGRIAAANAASDVYAMGGAPLFALNLVAWPRDVLPLDLLGAVLEGGSSMAAEGGWVVGGGHTVDGPEPMYGQAVTGEVDPDAILTNAGGEAGQRLLLTKPIGTGIVATAIKRSEPAAIADGGPLASIYSAAVTEMTRLNADAGAIAVRAGSRCATDITGFGLLGHLHKLALASGVAATVEAAAPPLLDGVVELVGAGFVPGGTSRNLEFVDEHLDVPDEVDPNLITLLADAQTSGGLLIACPGPTAPVLAELEATGHIAAEIGSLAAGRPGRIHIR